MAPASRGGMYISRARLEPKICLQCRFRLERHFSTSPTLDSTATRLRSRCGKTRTEGTTKAQSHLTRLHHSSNKVPNDQISCELLHNRNARDRGSGNVTIDYVKRSFATHVDSQPPKLDELPELLRQSVPREKVDIKSKLRAWQQEYDKSDEATLPYATHLASSTTLRAKARQDINVVQNLKDQVLREEDDDNEGLGFSSDVDDAPSVVSTPGVEAGFLQKGDMVELQGKAGSLLSIFLRAIGEEHEFLTVNGVLTHQRLNNIHLSISPFVEPQLLKPLLSQLPPDMSEEGHVDTWAPRESSAPLLQALLEFDRAAKDFYQQHAARLDNLHDEIAFEKDFRYMSTRNIAGYITGHKSSTIKDHELLAVHRSVMKSPIGFRISHRYHRFTHSVEIMPKRSVRSFRKAMVWLRDLQEASIAQANSQNPKALPFQIKFNPVGPFLEKARKLIAASRLHRSTSKQGRVGSDSTRVRQAQESDVTLEIKSEEVFTLDEAHLVRFVRFWAADSHVAGPYVTTMDALASRLVRATGCYDEFDIDRSTGFTFLQEIGVLTPWDTRVGWNHRLRLKERFPGLRADRLSHEALLEAGKWRLERPTDIMKDLRKDWGSLEVFSVDPALTSIIDDGFSVENVQDEPGIYWLHMHIANPTCFMQPDNEIAISAKEIMTTTHTPEHSYHLMHPNTIREYFNLGPGQPVLTFSAKLDLDGNLLDKSICPGIIHNCIHLDSPSVQEALQPGSTVEVPWVNHMLGNFPDRQPKATRGNTQSEGYQHIDENALNKLRLIQKLALARARRRPNWELMRYRDEAPLVVASFPTDQYETSYQRDNPTYVYKASGDPHIKIKAIRFDPYANSARVLEFGRIVDDAMIIACEVAGQWCKERNIPTVYRGTVFNSEVISIEQFQERVVKPAIARTGKPPFFLIREYAGKATRSLLSVVPMQHQALGIDAYSRVTSPLRRYAEMVAHWQIESALRYEHETGKSLVGCENPGRFLTFTRKQIESLFVRMIESEVLTGYAATNANLSWISMFFFRAHHYGEGNLPPTLSVFVKRFDFAKRPIGTLEMINVDVRIMETDVSEAEGGVQIGDWWECKIHDVNAYQNKITMEPVKLTERKGDELCLDLQSRVQVRNHERN